MSTNVNPIFGEKKISCTVNCAFLLNKIVYIYASAVVIGVTYTLIFTIKKVTRTFIVADVNANKLSLTIQPNKFMFSSSTDGFHVINYLLKYIFDYFFRGLMFQTGTVYSTNLREKERGTKRQIIIRKSAFV